MASLSRPAQRARGEGSLLLVGLLALSVPLAAAPPSDSGGLVPAGAASPAARTWAPVQGLPNSTVRAIAQTADGYLWFGTRRGLARFDGVRLAVFDRRNQPDWASDTVYALAPARDGGLWVGLSEGGLVGYRKGVFTPVPVPTRSARALRDARDGSLWVGMDRGLARVQKGDQVEVFESFASIYVHGFYEDPDGTLWLATSAGLYVRRRGEFVRVEPPRGPPLDDEVYTVHRGADGVMWAGTRRGRLYRITDSHAVVVGQEDGAIWSVLEDRRRVVWVAGESGVKYVHRGRLEPVPGDRAAGEAAFAMLEDREGSLWIGQRFSGAVRLTAGRATAITHDLEHPTVLTVLEDRQGALWFGTTGGGLGRLDRDGLSMFAAPDSRALKAVGAILEDRQGRLWFGPQGGDSIQWIENGRVKSRPLRGIPVSLYEDPDGALWVGTLADGLYRLSNGHVTQWTPRDGLPSRAVRAIAADGRGSLWLGTPRGLVRFRGRPTEIYTRADGLRSDRIMALYQEPDGPLWIGTSRGGLARLERGRFTSYGTDQGLCDNQVLAILDDRLGNLWMSSERGIFRVSKALLNDVAAGTSGRIACKAFGRGDGMKSEQCMGGIQPSAWRARDGRLWFPTVEGLVVIDPNDAQIANTVPPPVIIEMVLVDGRELSLPVEGRLPAGTRTIQIDYTALSLVAPEKVRFRYRLRGFDREWVDAGSRRQISYVGLPPGRYGFEVIASNNDGVWNEEGERWEFRIEPYFYQTAWFYVLAGAIAISLVSGLHVLRVRELRLRNALLAERTQLSHEIHDHVSQVMTGIVLQLDAASQTMSEEMRASRAYIQRASHLARLGIEETRMILRSLREGSSPGGVEEAQVDRAIAEQVAPLVEGTGVRLRSRRQGTPYPLQAEVRREIFHVGREAVTNSLRHGRARNIDILVAFEPRGVRLKVEDDGGGFEVAALERHNHPGLGLQGMAKRIADQRGTFDVRSLPGAGTTITAFFPKQLGRP